MKSLSISTRTIQYKLSTLILLSILFITGCSNFANRSLSSDYFAGLKSSEIYAKQDAINDKCINYPVSLSNSIMKNTRKHLEQLKKRNHPDFINGFIKGYNDEYREYMSLYCDNLDSPNEHIRP
ncbi:MAG: hypothetical protein HQK62_00680 [Desulfamplus sp.]|nr:hypothetical protein [Desulfamplus sp.]MBF0257348.1 hypothetical protein [Desulfamplus sp.]